MCNGQLKRHTDVSVITPQPVPPHSNPTLSSPPPLPLHIIMPTQWSAVKYSTAEDGPAEEVTTGVAAEEPGMLRPTVSQPGSGSAASALEAFLDSAAQPTGRHAQSYSRYSRTPNTRGICTATGCLTQLDIVRSSN